MAIVRAHQEQRAREGLLPAFYFFDIFVLNQHTLTMDCTVSDDGFELLMESLKLSLMACGNVLLACSKGAGDAPGWSEPASLSRIWCLFELYVAISEDIPIRAEFDPPEAKAWERCGQRIGRR